MERLLNVEIDWDGIVEYGVVEGPSEYITKTEVQKTIRKIKSGKASGPRELMGEMIRTAGQAGVKKMTEICKMVVNEGKKDTDRLGADYP